MERKIVSRFSQKHRWDSFQTSIPINKSIKPTQVYKDQAPLFSAAKAVVAHSECGDSAKKVSGLSQEFAYLRERLYPARSKSTECQLQSGVPLVLRNKFSFQSMSGRSISPPKWSFAHRHKSDSATMHSSGSSYREYSLSDYRKITPKKYVVLGGLGPSHVGTEEWKAAYEKLQRVKQYGRKFKVAHL